MTNRNREMHPNRHDRERKQYAELVILKPDGKKWSDQISRYAVMLDYATSLNAQTESSPKARAKLTKSMVMLECAIQRAIDEKRWPDALRALRGISKLSDSKSSAVRQFLAAQEPVILQMLSQCPPNRLLPVQEKRSKEIIRDALHHNTLSLRPKQEKLLAAV